VVIVLFFGIANAGINDGLVAYYPFNGNANDESGNGNHGTNYGAIPTSDRFGKPNAFFFDGIDDYINIDKIASKLSGVGTGSVSVWFKTDEQVRIKTLFAYSNGTNNICDITLGDLTLCLSNESISVVMLPNLLFGYEKGPTYYADGKWHNAVFVMGTNYNALYMDGEKLSPTYVTPNCQSKWTGNSSTGNIMWNDITGASIGNIVSQPIYNYQGSIDDVRIYNRALSEEEIKQLFTSCPAEMVINYTAKASGNTVLTGLRAFRDHFLSKGEYGKSFIRRYYQHSDEGIQLMMEHPEWIALSAGLLEKIQPALLNAADTGALQLDESILQEIMSLMDEVKPYTSLELCQFIDTVQSRLQKRQAMAPQNE
jgi:hypothetical protein